MSPREHLEDPYRFGDSGARARAEHAGTAAGQAAVAQSMVVALTLARLRERGTSRAHVAARIGVSERHLRRIFSGERWARLNELVALGHVLETDLILLPGDPDENGKRRVRRLRDL